MNTKDILLLFNKINLPKRYIRLCNKFTNFENTKNSNKKEVEKIIKKHNCNLHFSREDSSFYEDLKIENIVCRFMIGYQHGMISSFYMIGNNKVTIFREENGEIIEKLGVPFFEKTQYRYPMSTSEEDLEEILEEILSIYKDFKKEFIKQYE
mgnify:CR=1 FL=1